MREFNTTGPCDPALHYTVMREALMLEGQKKVLSEVMHTFRQIYHQKEYYSLHSLILLKTPEKR